MGGKPARSKQESNFAEAYEQGGSHMAAGLRRGPRRWIWIALILGVLVLGSGAAFLGRSGFAHNKQTLKAEDLDLRIGKSGVSDIQVTVNEMGTIEPVVKVDVKSPLSGEVTELLVKEGDRVKRGQVLARVEPDVNQAQTLSAVRSELTLAEIRAQDAQKDLETNQRLYEEGLLAVQQLKDYRVKFDTAQRVNIVSPMDGTVVKRNVEVGQTVTSGVSSFNEGTPLYTVADVGSMLIKASINEVDIGRVRLGMPVVITVDAFPYRRFDGTVTHISPAARLKEKVKVFDVEVTLKEQIKDFRAGMTANIEVRGDKVTAALGIPVEAIFKKKDREVAYILKKPFDAPKAGEKEPRKTRSGKLDVSDVWQRFFEEKDVKVGLVSLEKAQIMEGLTDGVEVALEDPTKPRQVDENQ